MLKTTPATVFLWLLIASEALAQATTAPTTPTPAQPAAPTATHAAGDGVNWLWLLIAVAVIAAAVWYFLRRRATRPL